MTAVYVADTDAFAADADVAHKAGDEELSGTKTFQQPGADDSSNPDPLLTPHAILVNSTHGPRAPVHIQWPGDGYPDVYDRALSVDFKDCGFPGPAFQILADGSLNVGGALVVSGHPTGQTEFDMFQNGTKRRCTAAFWNDYGPTVEAEGCGVLALRGNGWPAEMGPGGTWPAGDGGHVFPLLIIEDKPGPVTPGLVGIPGNERYLIHCKGDVYNFFTENEFDCMLAEDYERFHQGYDPANLVYVIETQAGGTGVVRPIALQPTGGQVVIGPGKASENCVLTVHGNMFFQKDFAISFGVNESGAGVAPFVRSLAAGYLDFKIGLNGVRFIANNEGSVPFALDGEFASTFAGKVTAPQVISSAAASPDAALADGQFAFWLDEATNTLKVRAKYANGTLKSGSIPLS